MKTHIQLLLLIAALSIVSPLRAQIVADGTTNTLSNVTNNGPGTLTVGTNGSFTLLVLSNNALLNNTAIGVIGRNASARSNEVRLISATARWNFAGFGELYVGSNGASSRLTVSGGGSVSDYSGTIGQRASSTNNAVLVTDPGSQWSVTFVTLGNEGAFNQLTVSNGARLQNWLGGAVGVFATASNNQVTVTGAGSLWTNQSYMFLGSGSAENRTTVSAGGWLACRDGYVGLGATANRNTVLVTDTGSTWTNLVTLYVGESGSGNQLITSNGATVSVGGDAMVGFNTGANSNSVSVTGPGTSWLVASNLYVGSNGAFSQLVVSNGARVVARDSYVGSSASSRSNFTLVTGSGSFWSNSQRLVLGELGAGNQLVVSNGGMVTAFIGEIGESSFTSNNVAVITGAGSLWAMPNGTLIVGVAGNGNQLLITDGGRALAANVRIGQDSSIVNNVAVVTGAGSVLTNATLVVGNAGKQSLLVVSNAGLVQASASATVGVLAVSTNNRVVVDGGTLRATNLAGNSFLDVRRGTNVLHAGLIEADLLLLTNTLSKFEFNGGTLITRGALITNTGPFVVGVAGTNPAVWDVRTGWSNHVLNVPLSLGQFSSFNQLLVTNGALLTSAGGFIGLNLNARSNTAIVAGPGSTWSNSLTLEIGSAGPINSLVVSNGGFVRNTSGTLGSFGGNNLALVTGSSSVWSNADLTIGSASASNHLVVSDGGTVANNYAFVSFGFDSSNNLATVTGSNAVWRTVNQLNFGYVGAGNQLVVTNGGKVLSDSCALGLFTSRSNTALVTGTGSVLSNANLMFIGENSAGNRLVVANGGELRSGSTFVGYQSSSSNNVALVKDSGSALNSDVTAGLSGARNQLVVSNGAVAQGSYGAVGVFASASNNLALVTDSGSVWSNALELQVGFLGGGNQLVVSNGALVAAGLGFIGKNTNANLNSAIVTDPGTRWLLSSNLFAGSNGAFSQLVITNGAFVADGSGFIGAGNSSSNNLAVVTGPGSVWSNASDFFVGSSGSGNQLVVGNGALVIASAGFIGRNTNANLNSALVTDPGTRWLINSNFYVGSNGTSGQLVISNGALLFNSNAWLGFSATSRSNVAVVTGAGTTWSNQHTLSVGEFGSGNRLVLSDGARIESKFGMLGLLTSGNDNEAVVSGPGSFWRMEQGLTVGGIGSGNRLVITNGGSVRNSSGTIGSSSSSTSNEVVVTGPGSSWTIPTSTTFIGAVGSNCRLVISNGGAVVQQSFGLILGTGVTSTNNRIEVDGGTLLATNVFSGTLDVRRGTTVLNAGLIEVAQLLLTNAQGFLQFNSGTFSARNSHVSNGTLFTIGNGINPATFRLAGNGLHVFTGILAARVSSNATFTGNGTIGGVVPLQFLPGSRLVPGTSVGQVVFSNPPALQGLVVMEVSKNGGTLTNDQIQVIASLTYGGSLVVSNLGPTALVAGDRFPLFSASSYAGGFTNIILPPLSPGLGWTNKLLVDGSIEVVVGPQFTSISLSGTNLIFAGTGGMSNAPYAVLTATNVVEPLSNWLSLVTNQFDLGGGFSFTNGILPGELQRYFRIRTP